MILTQTFSFYQLLKEYHKLLLLLHPQLAFATCLWWWWCCCWWWWRWWRWWCWWWWFSARRQVYWLLRHLGMRWERWFPVAFLADNYYGWATLSKVATQWLEVDSNLRPSGCKAQNIPLHHSNPWIHGLELSVFGNKTDFISFEIQRSSHAIIHLTSSAVRDP